MVQWTAQKLASVFPGFEQQYLRRVIFVNFRVTTNVFESRQFLTYSQCTSLYGGKGEKVTHLQREMTCGRGNSWKTEGEQIQAIEYASFSEHLKLEMKTWEPRLNL